MFLFHGGPSKLQAMLVLGCVVGGLGGEATGVWTQAEDRVTRSRERNMVLRGCWKEDSVSSVYEEKKKKGGE